jgi:Tol biopolymer transport system component
MPQRHGYSRNVSSFSWSPDSKTVVFIDCISDWIEKRTDSGGGSIGETVNNKCSIAVVALDGAVTSFPLPPDVPLYTFNPAEGAHLAWKGDSVILTWPATGTFKVP